MALEALDRDVDDVEHPTAEGIDCTVDACAIYTRNDHTALNDRVQDVYIPIGYAD